jgi:hypothetical protein
MGYSYQGRSLCCDVCGKVGARKVKCPFGYCGATAYCPECRKAKASREGKKAHRAAGCEANHIKFEAELKAIEDRKAEGKFVRCSAMSKGQKGTQVLFSNKDKACIGFYMPREAYFSLPLSAPATPEDFLPFGLLVPAPSDFYSEEA